MSTLGPTTIYKPGDSATLDLGSLGARVVYDCSGLDSFDFGLALKPPDAWPAGAVATVKYSQTGRGYYPNSKSPTLTAAGVTTPQPVTPYRLVALEVTTAGASSVLADVTGSGEAQR